MAKTINYKYLASEINHGTEENPNIEQNIIDKFFICPTQESYDQMYPIAEKEAIHGTIEVTGEFDPEPVEEPTAEEIINVMLGVNRYA